MSRALLLLASLAAALAAAVPTAAAQDPLPVGQADGVRIVRQKGAIVVVFTKPAQRLFRRVAGKRVSVLCTELHSDGSTEGGTTLRAPRRGRRIRTRDHTRGIDYCRLWLESRAIKRKGRRIRTERQLIASVPLTQEGAVYLDEQKKTGRLRLVLARAEETGMPETLEALMGGAPVPADLVLLAGAGETPAAGAVGYWSDGAGHVAVVTLSSTGRRLFIEYEGDVLRTNVAYYIYEDLD